MTALVHQTINNLSGPPLAVSLLASLTVLYLRLIVICRRSVSDTKRFGGSREDRRRSCTSVTILVAHRSTARLRDLPFPFDDDDDDDDDDDYDNCDDDDYDNDDDDDDGGGGCDDDYDMRTVTITMTMTMTLTMTMKVVVKLMPGNSAGDVLYRWERSCRARGLTRSQGGSRR